MKMNIEKVLERDSKLTQIDERADALQVRLDVQTGTEWMIDIEPDLYWLNTDL
jgi:hypothetical protein